MSAAPLSRGRCRRSAARDLLTSDSITLDRRGYYSNRMPERLPPLSALRTFEAADQP